MKNNERDERKTRKVLVPLATLTVAAAVAVGSGATFTSSSKITADITAGQIIADNDHEDGTLTITKLKPGDKASGTVQLTRGTGSDLNGVLTVVIDNVTSGFDTDAVSIEVTGNGTTKWADLETVANSATGKVTLDLGNVPAGWSARNVVVTVSMPTSADNDNQGATGKADINFVLTATDGSTDHQTTATW